ncbi:MAG: imidazolonepropionase [Legionellaceae bacterium]|nr:imidazolonepropionase [Legionellaceae bacterium]
MNYDLVINNATIATCDKHHTKLDHASIAICDGLIVQITQDKPQLNATKMIDAEGQLLTPGLIDCHTHLVYGGNRANEFSMRLKGATYADIANQGGGILSTVKATRNASRDELTKTAKQRADVMLAHGTTTVEIKSGYGLDLETEVKLLTVAQSLATLLPISVVTTFLGAHTTPPEYQHDKDGYIDYIISTVMPIIARDKLATFVDAFCETIAFSPSQVERLFRAALQHGFLLKLHAEQLTDQKSALLAAQFQASSVDHLECLAPEDCGKLRNNKTVAVLLPGAFYFLKEKQRPPVEALREHNIPIAIATDANPGSSPFLTLPLMMNMACILFGLSIEEAWLAVTIHAAQALNLDHEIGSIAIGKKADLILWSTDNINDIVYNSSINYCQQVIKAGVLL